MAIGKVSGVEWANIASYGGVAKANIANLGGQTAPSSTSLPSQVDYLLGWWDPSEATSGDTTLDNKTYTDSIGVTSNINHYMGGASGGAITTLNGINCWYLDGVNDRVYTYNLNNTGTNWPLNTNRVEWTIEGWVRSNGSWISNGNWWNMGYNNAYRNRFTSSGNLWNYWRTSRQTTTRFATNTWHHIAVTTEALSTNSSRHGTGKVYHNGSLIQTWTNINTDPNQSGRTNFWGGFTSRNESGRFYMGINRIYNTHLTAAEISDNYDLEKSTYGHS